MTEKNLYMEYRSFLKDSIRKTFDFSKTDQHRGVPPPPIEKPYLKEARRIDLPRHDELGDIGLTNLKSAMMNRESRRSYSAEPMTLAALSFLLWATQGMRQRLDPGHALRTVPSAGCRHALETYLCVLNVQGLDQGIYRYLPVEHQLLQVADRSSRPVTAAGSSGISPGRCLCRIFIDLEATIFYHKAA